MKKTIVYILAFVMITGCTVDNYSVPELALSGKIIDIKTGELVPSSGANDGSVVQLFEGNATQPLLFNTLPDGTFKNTRLFPASYKVVAVGPFALTGDTLTVDVHQNTEIEITVTPNVQLTLKKGGASGDSFEMTVNFTKKAMAQKITKLGVVWSPFPYPNATVHPDGDVKIEDVSSQNLTEGVKHYTIEGLQAGTTYYVRAFALTDNPGGYYNYSTQLVLE